MGNKLSTCSCGPLIRKAYRYEDSPWQNCKRRDGHLLRLWAEVFHVSASGTGTIKWAQVSEDLVPVNITCIQDHPECVFHITAYNSQVDKILDVRLVQPGTRIGQASECFVYWKDPLTNDTWGLNFTSPIDAKQFRECCSPSFKFSRKASSSYSLKLEPPNKQSKVKTKRKPLSTPASPSRSREPQCTCMTADQYARLKAQDPRFRGSSTLPRTQSKSENGTDVSGSNTLPSRDKVTTGTSSGSLYDTVGSDKSKSTGSIKQMKDRETATPGGKISSHITANAQTPHATTSTSTSTSQTDDTEGTCKSEGVQAGIHKTSTGTCTPRLSVSGKDYMDDPNIIVNHMSSSNVGHGRNIRSNTMNKYMRDDLRRGAGNGMNVDSNTLKRMLKPMPSLESPVTSPEMSRRRYHYYPLNAAQGGGYYHHMNDSARDGALSEPETHSRHRPSRISGSRSTHDISRERDYATNRLYLDLDRDGRTHGDFEDASPPSDNDLFDNQCYATTPSSSNGRVNAENATVSTPSSPTSRLLLEYEMHLRNTLARGMDAESYSLHTFEALLTQSMENLEFAEKLPQINTRSPHISRRRQMGSNSSNKTATLPHRLSLDRANSTSRDREGYYSDRNELARERDRDRGYLSDREQRDRGYLSDHNISSNRCNSCLGGSSRSQWFRHSDGWRSGTSTMSSMSSAGPYGLGSSFQNDVPLNTKRSAWESLPSLRHEGSMSDGGYKLGRSDSLERRALRDRHDPYRYDRDGMLSHQTSVESTDSKLCYLTSSEMSDDDRMSLTTAISDDEDIDESLQNSPYSRARKANSASFNCTGAVRKAGFLSVKKWLLRKKKQIELARKRGWKGYWVCLKGTTLLFYPCDSRERHSPDAAPKHLIIVDGAIMQPIPEHPKRDYIFCLSTAFGDAYLFQAPCQVELENWINSIHSACAAAFARHRGKTGTFHLLSEEVFKVEKALESDHKMKHMAELQLSVVSDPDMKQQLSNQIMQYEENMERLYCEQFRLRCYISSLQNGELPNPKNLLTHVSRPTKHALNKLGVFTVSSFHAYICSRSPSLLNNLLAGRGSTKRRAPMLSRSNSASSRRSLSMSSRDEERTVKVSLPDNQTTQIYLKDAMTVEEYIASACLRKNLNPMQHFVRVKKRKDMEDHNYFVPHRSDLIETYLNTHEIVEICVKVLYQVELVRTSVDHMWGFSVEAELIENTDRQDELCVWVSRVEDKGTAVLNGIIKGDEIMVINSSIVSDLDMMYIESVLQEELCLCMMMRSSRIEPPSVATTASILRNTDDIESLVCPPPPTDPPVISEEMISGLIVPAPCYTKDQQTEMVEPHPRHSKKLPIPRESANTASSQTSTITHTHTESGKQPSRASSLEIENLVKSAGEVTGFCRSPVETERSSPTGSVLSSQSQLHTATTPNKVLTDAEKLRKVILELIETERTYVKHLNNLLENYLEPLKKETFLTTAEISVLFGNILEIINFQHQFLENLNEALAAEVHFHEFDHPSQFKNILFSIGSAFLYYVDHFKLYSSFCASHSKAQKILNPNEGNYALQEFLAARNPRQQHSSTLESYLIKPIQRILKYPLLLQQLRNLTDPNTDEHLHLVEALKGMEKVAEHINEMQRIHEEYGAIFDHLFRQHQKPIDLSPGDLLYYGGVEWINISDFIGKIKKGLELHAMCFVFKSAVVFLCKERIRQKKKLMSVSTNKGGDVEIIRYQVLIPVTDVQVRTMAKEGEDHFLWELVHMRCHPQRRSERVYLLSNSTNDFRNAFIKTIRQTIRESVRNMNIPANKAPQLPKIPINVMTPRTPMSAPPVEKSVEKMLPSENPPTKMTDSATHTVQNPPAKLKKIPPKPPQRRSSTVTTEHNESNVEKSTKSKPDYDPGTKSEGEEDSQCSTIREKSKTLGKTPNHLTLSTASTLSTGSTGSQARLIQSSQHPENYQPPIVKDLGSPVWKPRDMGESLTLPRKNKTPSTSVESRTLVRKPNSKKEKL
ncbi:protein still life, isoform SIF type 1 isoform X2 [Planococcus citri]|uniref:protein still life, isoform SIF type 1 isoform X2 n=1 Tax=Planococcus citri TaxID=170843 RepID=UPI0031F80F0A